MKKTLKNIGIVLLVALGFAMFALALVRSSDTITYTATIGTTTPVVEEPESDVAKAERMLAEATEKLNKEEQALLDERTRIETERDERIAAIEAEAAAQLAEVDAKLDEVNRVRLGFTPTDGQ